MKIFVTIVVGTLVLAGVYTLISLGFVYIYRATGLVNFAHGELLLLGALIAYTASVGWGAPSILALFIAMGITGIAMCIIYKVAWGYPLNRTVAGQAALQGRLAYGRSSVSGCPQPAHPAGGCVLGCGSKIRS